MPLLPDAVPRPPDPPPRRDPARHDAHLDDGQLERNVWTCWMRRYGDPGVPGEHVVQMSPDGVVRAVYFLQQGTTNQRSAKR